MGGDQNGGIRQIPADAVQHHGGSGFIKAFRRLIQKQQVGAAQQGAGQSKASRLPTREPVAACPDHRPQATARADGRGKLDVFEHLPKLVVVTLRFGETQGFGNRPGHQNASLRQQGYVVPQGLFLPIFDANTT